MVKSLINEWWDRVSPDARRRLLQQQRSLYSPFARRAIAHAAEFDQAMQQVMAFSDLDHEELEEVAETARKIMRESWREMSPKHAVSEAARPYYSGERPSRKQRRERRHRG